MRSILRPLCETWVYILDKNPNISGFNAFRLSALFNQIYDRTPLIIFYCRFGPLYSLISETKVKKKVKLVRSAAGEDYTLPPQLFSPMMSNCLSFPLEQKIF